MIKAYIESFLTKSTVSSDGKNSSANEITSIPNKGIQKNGKK